MSHQMLVDHRERLKKIQKNTKKKPVLLDLRMCITEKLHQIIVEGLNF